MLHVHVSIINVIFFVNKCIFSTSFQRRQLHLKVDDMPLQLVRILLLRLHIHWVLLCEILFSKKNDTLKQTIKETIKLYC